MDRTVFSFTALSAFLLVPIVGLSGCTQAQERVDCQRICDRYKECFDTDYDVAECVDDCSNSDDINTADECEACIDDRSCTGSFACTTECAGIIP